MSQAEDLLNDLTSDVEAEEHIIIDKNRFITVPEYLKKIAVQFDNNVNTVTFDCPRYSDGRDLSEMAIYINYMRPDGKPGSFPAENVVIDENDTNIIHFDWTIKEHVTIVDGKLSFLVCAKKNNSEGYNEIHWNSELNQDMTISKGLNCVETIIESYPDLISQILIRLDTFEKNLDYDKLPNKPIERISGTSDSPIILSNLQSGQYQIYGEYRPYDGSDDIMSTDKPVLANISKDEDVSNVQILLADENKIQYLSITDSSYTLNNISFNQLASDNELSIKRRETVINDANYHITNGYAKTEYGVTQNLPDKVYGGSIDFSSEWGVLFFIAENETNKTGTQIFYPIEGPYKGRMFIRSVENMSSAFPKPGDWYLISDESDAPKYTTINLPISGWTGSDTLYQQTVTVPAVTANSQVDLRPSPSQLQELLSSDISLMAANDSGTVTVFAIGGKPTTEYTMQIIVSEVVNS